MLSLTPIYGIEMHSLGAERHPRWAEADSGNVFKTEDIKVAEATIEKMKEGGCIAHLTVGRYDLVFVSKEALHARWAAIFKAAQRVCDSDPYSISAAMSKLHDEVNRE